MPKFRLSEVIEQNPIDLSKLSPEIRDAIDRLIAQPNKLDAETAKDLRAIAEHLNISIFDLFTPAEQFYRLKIFEYLTEPEYSGSPKQKLEVLLAKLSQSSQISFPLLAIYATQVLPESLLKGSDLKQISKSLSTSLESLKEVSSAPKSTIAVEVLLKKLGITLDELEILIDVPKKFIPWLSLDIINDDKDTKRRKRFRASSIILESTDGLSGESISESICIHMSYLPFCKK